MRCIGLRKVGHFNLQSTKSSPFEIDGNNGYPLFTVILHSSR